MTRQHRPPGMAAGWLLRIGAFVAVIAAVLAALPRHAMPAHVQAQAAAPPAPVFTQGWETDRLIVQFRPGATRQLVAAVAGGDEIRYVPELGASVVRPRAGQTLDSLLATLQASPDVAFVQPDYRRRITLTPNDPGYASQQWGPQKINAPAAWDITTGSSSVVIAVIDTGVDAGHPDLAGRVLGGWDFVHTDDDPDDDHGHGTHVAGIAAARGNNSTGMAGLAWGARVRPYKVLDAQGSGYDSDVAAAITRATQDGAKVLNLSLGGPGSSQVLTAAVNAAVQSGVLVIASAGNEQGPVSYPAAIPGVIAVSATTSSDAFASSYSNYGQEIDVAAPGSSIYSTVPDGSCELCDPSGYLRLSGTSMASPHVAGLAALIWSVNGSLTNAQVRQLIEDHAVDLGAQGKDVYFGNGRINAGASVGAASSAPTATPTATATGTPCPNRSCTATPTATPSATPTQCPRGGCGGGTPPPTPTPPPTQCPREGCGGGTPPPTPTPPPTQCPREGCGGGTPPPTPTPPPTQCPRGGCGGGTPSPTPTPTATPPGGCGGRNCGPPPSPPPTPPTCTRC